MPWCGSSIEYGHINSLSLNVPYECGSYISMKSEEEHQHDDCRLFMLERKIKELERIAKTQGEVMKNLIMR